MRGKDLTLDFEVDERAVEAIGQHTKARRISTGVASMPM